MKGKACVALGLFLFASFAVILYYGCSQESKEVVSSKLDSPSTPGNNPGVIMETDEVNHKICQALIGGLNNHAILARNMADPNVASAIAQLTSDGYSLTESNSVVLIESHYLDDIADGPSYPNRGKINPEFYGKRIIWADTVVWLAFENPTHDSAVHTGLVTNIVDGTMKTVLIELDVSTQVTGIIRQGLIINGEFQPQDIGVEQWNKCIASGLLASGIICTLSNCGYAACLGTGIAATALGCTIALFWDMFD